LLVRRSLSTPTELTAAVVFAPAATPLEHYEVRSWTGRYRHSTLALWALALRTVMRAGTIAVEALKKSLPPPQEASPLVEFKA
jgi:hypothetical protein